MSWLCRLLGHKYVGGIAGHGDLDVYSECKRCGEEKWEHDPKNTA